MAGPRCFSRFWSLYLWVLPIYIYMYTLYDPVYGVYACMYRSRVHVYIYFKVYSKYITCRPCLSCCNSNGVAPSLQAFWRDGFDRFPWAGKAFFSASSLAGVLITRWQGLFLDEGDGPRGTWYDIFIHDGDVYGRDPWCIIRIFIVLIIIVVALL